MSAKGTRVPLYTMAFIRVKGDAPYDNPLGIYTPTFEYSPVTANDLSGPTISPPAFGINVWAPLQYPLDISDIRASQVLPRGDPMGRTSTVSHSFFSTFSVSMERSASAAAYASGQVIGTTGSAAEIVNEPLPEFAGFNGTDNLYFRGRLVAQLNVAVASAAAFDFDVFIFLSAPSFAGGVDYDVFAPILNDTLLLVGSHSFVAADAVGWGANKFLYSAQQLGWLITPEDQQVQPENRIWVALVARSAWTPPAVSSAINVMVQTMT